MGRLIRGCRYLCEENKCHTMCSLPLSLLAFFLCLPWYKTIPPSRSEGRVYSFSNFVLPLRDLLLWQGESIMFSPHKLMVQECGLVRCHRVFKGSYDDGWMDGGITE